MKSLLKCLEIRDFIEDAYTLGYIENALLRTHFDGPMEAKPLEGVWKFLDWIPIFISNEYVAGTTTYKAEALGMSNLWVTLHAICSRSPKLVFRT